MSVRRNCSCCCTPFSQPILAFDWLACQQLYASCCFYPFFLSLSRWKLSKLKCRCDLITCNQNIRCSLGWSPLWQRLFKHWFFHWQKLAAYNFHKWAILLRPNYRNYGKWQQLLWLHLIFSLETFEMFQLASTQTQLTNGLAIPSTDW